MIPLWDTLCLCRKYNWEEVIILLNLFIVFSIGVNLETKGEMQFRENAKAYKIWEKLNREMKIENLDMLVCFL